MALSVLIAGGGLAGLATAVSLRRAGHQVQVFEASQFAFEDVTGPIVHIGPKNNDLLRKWDFDSATARGVLVREVSEFNQDGTLKLGEGASQPPGWEYYERSRLHQALLNSATASTGLGIPVKIYLGTVVRSVDPETARLTLDDGRIIQGDLVVAADGFHSTIRQSIFGNDAIISRNTKVAVYFTIAATAFDHNSMIQRFQSQPERYEKWFGAGLQLTVYATEPQNLLFDCTIQMQGQTDITGSVLKERILETFKSAPSEFIQVLAGVDAKDIYFRTQSSLPRVDTWTSKRLVLVGDAAHPFLPFELPGTSQTLLDAAALGAALGPGVGADEIEDCLAAWETPRKERVKFIQQIERAS